MSNLNEAILALQEAMTDAGITCLTVKAAERQMLPRASDLGDLVRSAPTVRAAVMQALEEHGELTVHEIHSAVTAIRGVEQKEVSVRVELGKLVKSGMVEKTSKKRRPEGIVTATGRPAGLSKVFRLTQPELT